MTRHPWTPWNPTLQPRFGAGGVRVYCLPHAGGAASSYLPWAAPGETAGLEICPVELPGHGIRMGEPPITTMQLIVEAMFQELFTAGPPGPYALFGHSMGALIAYELTHRISDSGQSPPLALLVSGARPPGSPSAQDLNAMADEQLLDTLVALGGTPRPLAAIRDLMRLMLPTLRADLRLSARYHPAPRSRLTCPIRAYGGADDPVANPMWLERWSQFTTAPFSMRTFAGGHFYTAVNPHLLIDDIAAQLSGHRACSWNAGTTLRGSGVDRRGIS